MQWLPVAALSGALLLVGGCFDRDNGHPGKDDADTTKPSLQMQQPSEKPAPNLRPILNRCQVRNPANKRA